MSERRAHRPLEERRRELTETAVRVMARDGAWALTTRAVAKEAGVPHGTVHYAFSSKDELLRSVMHLDLSHMADLVEDHRTRRIDGVADVQQVLSDMFAAYADWVISAPETEIAYFELSLLAARDAGLRASARQAQQEQRRLLAGFLDELAERVGCHWDADVDVVTGQVTAVSFGAVIGWLDHRNDELLRAVLADAAGMFARRLTSGE